MTPWNLSQRECACMSAMIQHGSVKAAAKALGLSDRTIETYTRHARVKMGERRPIIALFKWDKFVRETGYVFQPETRAQRTGSIVKQVLDFVQEREPVRKRDMSAALNLNSRQVDNALKALHMKGAIHLEYKGRESAWRFGPKPLLRRSMVNSVFALGAVG